MPTLIALYGISCHICMNNSLKEERKACNFTAECPLWPYVFRWLLLLPCVWETRGAITAIVTLTWGADCQKTSSLILASACIKTTFSGLLKTQEAHFEIKIHGRRKTWNVFCFNGAEKKTTPRELPTANNCRFRLAAKTGSYMHFLVSHSSSFCIQLDTNTGYRTNPNKTEYKHVVSRWKLCDFTDGCD